MPNGIATFRREPANGGIECRWGSQKLWFWAYIWLDCQVNRQVLSTWSPVDHSHCPASCDTSLVVSGGVDCGRRQWNVYDKKPQRYAKDNSTSHLTGRSDKSVAYVTNNKRLYSTFCTVEANCWQTQSIARPLCNSRATCSMWFLKVYKMCKFSVVFIDCISQSGSGSTSVSWCITVSVVYFYGSTRPE